MKKRILVLCLLLSMALLFSACDNGKKNNDSCEHTFSAAWSSDATNHWHQATCEHGEVKGDLAAHVDADQDGVCDVCAHEIGHEHTFAADWSSDESKHWKAATCTHADQKSGEGFHADDDKNYKCDVCGAHSHILNTATGYCDGCNTQITEIDTSVMGSLLNAIIASSNKVVSGSVDYDAIFRGLESNYTLSSDVEYKLYTDGLYTKLVEGTWANEVWKQLNGEEVIAVSVETVDGVLYYAEPTTGDVESLAGYYFAVSNLANNYGSENILSALYEIAKNADGVLTKIDNYVEEINKDTRTAKFSYGVLVINTDTAEGEDDAADYFQVAVEFGYSEANVLTSLKIVCDCYSNSLDNEAENDYTYDQATKTITMKDTAKADTYTFVVAQTEGAQTAIDMTATEAYIPTDLTIYADAACTTVATTLTVQLGTPVADLPVFYVACPEGTFIRFLDDITVSVDKSGLEAHLNKGDMTIWFAPASAGTYVITLSSGSISKSVTVVVEGSAVQGSVTFDVIGTDNNTFDGQQYDFVAPASGTYTIFVPAGCGAIDIDAYNSWGAPYVDPFMQPEGGSFTITLAEGKTYSFYFMVPTKNEAYIFSYNFVAHEVEEEGGDDIGGGTTTDNGTVTVGDNTVVITQDEYSANTTTRTFAVTENGNYKFASGSLFISAITDANGNAVSKNADYTYTLEAGKTYTITFSMLSSFASVGENTLTITNESAPAGGEGDEGGDDATSDLVIGENTITVTDADITAQAIEYTLVVTNAGTYSFASNYLMAQICDSNGMFIANGMAYLDAGTYTIKVVTAYVSAAGNYTLTVTYTAPATEDAGEGTESDPYVIDSLPAEYTFYSDTINKVYYLYTATADGVITITCSVENDSWFDCFLMINGMADGQNSQTSNYETVATFTVEAGKTYRIGLGTFWTAGDATFTLTFTEGEVGGGDEGGNGEDFDISAYLGVDEETAVEVTTAHKTAGKLYASLFSGDAGEYSIESNDLYVVAVYDADGNVIARNDNWCYELEAYTMYTVELGTQYVSAGEYSVTVSYQYPEGHQNNPS